MSHVNDTASAADEQAIVDAVEVWAEKELRPVARKFDLADEYPHEIVEQMKELGLFGATIPQEYGGLGLSAWTYAQIVIKVASIWMAPSGIFNSHLIMARIVFSLSCCGIDTMTARPASICARRADFRRGKDGWSVFRGVRGRACFRPSVDAHRHRDG